MNRALTKKIKGRLDKTIGQNIRKERELHKMTREELAEALDLTISHMGLIERGERGATAVTLEKLSRVFNLQIDTLFAEPEPAFSVREDGGSNVAFIRRKITTLLTRLDERETEIVLHLVSGIISQHSNRAVILAEEFE
ncbi:MAG: helix-turn-helix domain-containing protein [Clostridiales bacterium]|nr:helix-turn-helix domain-containing protein [Clostridiales bacterium]